MDERMAAFLVSLLFVAGCEGGSDGVVRQPEPVDPICDSTSVLEGGDFATVNRTLFVDGAAFAGKSVWIYAESDSFYSLDHSRSNFDAFTQPGGVADFEVFRRDPGRNGHFIINDAQRWDAMVDAYIRGLQ